jgi:hypothetical protein
MNNQGSSRSLTQLKLLDYSMNSIALLEESSVDGNMLDDEQRQSWGFGMVVMSLVDDLYAFEWNTFIY